MSSKEATIKKVKGLMDSAADYRDNASTAETPEQKAAYIRNAERLEKDARELKLTILSPDELKKSLENVKKARAYIAAASDNDCETAERNKHLNAAQSAFERGVPCFNAEHRASSSGKKVCITSQTREQGPGYSPKK
jgi:hypothetical protein